MHTFKSENYPEWTVFKNGVLEGNVQFRHEDWSNLIKIPAGLLIELVGEEAMARVGEVLEQADLGEFGKLRCRKEEEKGFEQKLKELKTEHQVGVSKAKDSTPPGSDREEDIKELYIDRGRWKDRALQLEVSGAEERKTHEVVRDTFLKEEKRYLDGIKLMKARIAELEAQAGNVKKGVKETGFSYFYAAQLCRRIASRLQKQGRAMGTSARVCAVLFDGALEEEDLGIIEEEGA